MAEMHHEHSDTLVSPTYTVTLARQICEDRIHGVLSCFDRMLFRGYLPIMSGWAMAQFLSGLELNGRPSRSASCRAVSSLRMWDDRY